MSEEEKKAIQELTEIKELVEEDLKYDDYEVTATLDQIDLKSLVIVLNLIEKQQKEKEKNKELEKQIELDKIQRLEYQKFLVQDFISKYKIKEKIEEYEEILQSSIIKEDYKLEVEHIIRVLEELKGE